MKKIKVKILSNKNIKDDFFKLRLEFPFSDKIEPGQFVHIRIGESFPPLLRRPFSISNAGCGWIDIVYKVVGKGTRLLSEFKEGKKLDIIGPCGRGFSVSPLKKRYLLAGGGVGVSPLVFLSRRILEKNKNALVDVFLGFKKKEDVILEEDFSGENLTLHIATEDGSYGYKGVVSELVESHIKNLSSLSEVKVYACGPTDMLRVFARLCFKYKICCEVLMEEIIGCGVGACRGCVVKGKEGYVRVCQEGPAFDIKELSWE